MELRDYVLILRKRWALIVLCALAGVAAATTYSLLQTPVYNSLTKVFVSTQSGETTQELVQGSNFTQARLKTYADLVSTPIVLLPVIATLDLDMSADDLAERITASAPLDTTLIEITVADVDPVAAANIANAVSQSLAAVVEEIETTGTNGASPVELTRVQNANISASPASPNLPLNVILGLLVGLAVGFGAAVLREVLDTRIRNERDIELITSAPIMGGIGFDPKAAERPLIVQDDPLSPRAESFRSLRTNLQFLGIESEARSLLITSSVEREGKSTTSANLAIAMADAGSRVLLVDADLRRPKTAEYMGLEGAVGLSDVLIRTAKLEDVIQPWGKGDLFVLPAGKVPPNPSELLGSESMQKLIGFFEQEFDAVIFDAPPLLPVTDSAILARRVRNVVVVVAAGSTHKNQLRGALNSLQNVDVEASGIVLTMLPEKGPDAYGYARYGYYGYGARAENPARA